MGIFNGKRCFRGKTNGKPAKMLLKLYYPKKPHVLIGGVGSRWPNKVLIPYQFSDLSQILGLEPTD